MRRLFVTIIWSVFFLIVCGLSLGYIAVKNGWIGYMPDLSELQSPISRYASQIYTADGKLIGTWSRNENRVFVDYDSISPYMFKALVATEDVRFYEHSGIDVRAFGRAVIKRGIMGQREAGGGSTITQQLAKQLYSSTARDTKERLMQKPIEWVIAVELEKHYTKEEILTMYLNYFDFLHNAVGIKTAAKVYFNKHPNDLTLAESALFVGMCKNPSYYNPVRHPERCVERRNVVLEQMVKAGYISPAEASEAAGEELKLDFHRVDHKEGEAPYLREYLRRIMMAQKPNPSDYKEWQSQLYYSDSLAWENDPLYGWCHKNAKRDGSHYDIYEDGLKIYTTIDTRMQRYAEEAMLKHLGQNLQPIFTREVKSNPNYPYARSVSKEDAERYLTRAMKQTDRYRYLKKIGLSQEEIEKDFNTPIPMTVFTYQGEQEMTMSPMDSIKYYKSFLRSGVVSIDPSNGHIKAYVGGPDFKYFQYDMAMVGRRQVGSTMKPFVYMMALQDGNMEPTSKVQNIQRNYGGWIPRNGSRACDGQQVTLKWGLSQSNNWVTAQIMNMTDPTGKTLEDYLHRVGVANNEIKPSMPLCLGTCDITVGEMASGYTIFVNKGMRSAPILVSRIEDSEGNIVAEFAPRHDEIISEETSYKMLDMMMGVINQGTGRRLRGRYNIRAQVAGKTGTTNENSDGWFIGCVPRLITACWVGGEERRIHFASTSIGQGAASALPIWAYYMQKLYADKTLDYSQSEKFDIPEWEEDDEGIDLTDFNYGSGSGGVSVIDTTNTIDEVFD